MHEQEGINAAIKLMHTAVGVIVEAVEADIYCTIDIIVKVAGSACAVA